MQFTMRKSLSILWSILVLSTLAQAQDCSLFFSEYAEGSSNNKYLEIYNPTPSDINLGGYAFPNVSNAPTVVGEYEFWNSFPDGATIAAGGTYLIVHGFADSLLLTLADHTFNFLSNGDDGFMLVQGTEASYTAVDAIGDFNGDPGSGWDVAGVSAATANHTLRRNSDISIGNGGDWATSAGDSLSSEWIVLENDYALNNGLEGYGTHVYTGVTCPVTTTSGCTDPEATNYDPNAGVDDGSCTYPAEVTISAIQQDMGAADDGAYNGQVVDVRGIVTGVYGSNTSIQDGTGAWSGIFVYVSGGLLDGLSLIHI